MLGAVAVAGGDGGGRVLGPCGGLRFPALGGPMSWAKSRRTLPPQQIRRFRQRRACTSAS